MTIKEYMTANREQVIDLIKEEVQFTKTNVKEASNHLVTADELFEKEQSKAVATKWDSAQGIAFKAVLKAVVETLIMSNVGKSDNDFWAANQASINRQKKSAFN